MLLTSLNEHCGVCTRLTVDSRILAVDIGALTITEATGRFTEYLTEILRLSCVMPKLIRSTYDCRVIYKTSYEERKAFHKIFNTRSSEIVTHCMQIFDSDNIESILLKRRTKFMRKFTEGVFGDVFG